jgi:arylsulfatase A-like enzyme/glycerophosphoryl diester phosphodiesterase
MGRYITFFLFFSFLVFNFYGQVEKELPLSANPNIILIMVDDLGYGDLGSYGQEKIRTPHIDKLARTGLRFTNYYSGSPVCAPSRESLLTGMHTGNTNVRGNFLTDYKEDIPMPALKITIAEMVKEKGYYTGLIGKWGLGGEGHGPFTQGFDYSYGYLDQIHAHNYFPTYLYENGKKILIPENENEEEKVYSHDLFVEKTLEFLNGRDVNQPFFLYLPYTIPHGDHVIPDNSEYDTEDWPERFKNYAAMITLLDSSVGEIMEKLKEKGLAENTVVIFTSDNGANMEFSKFFGSNGPLRGSKTQVYEGGIRVPFIIHWPGKIKAGEDISSLRAAWDLLPTIAELTDVPVPDSIDGISFYPTLFGEGVQKEHSHLYWEYYTYNWNYGKPGNELPRNWLESKAVRMGEWKAIWKKSDPEDEPTIELYDLKKNLGEEVDVADQNPAILEKMRKIFEASSSKNAPFFPYRLHSINTNTSEELKDFFSYTVDRIPIISAHRGGPRKGFPENCIATFENTLLNTTAILEIDPRYTKDGKIILMHDSTLDRTTNGSGKVSDYTLDQLRLLRLKDPEGNLTNHQIPTLDGALQWAKGKTILVIDAKDVPIEKRVEKIVQNQAEANAILIVYSLEDIEKVYEMNPNIMMEVMMGNPENVQRLDKSPVPWENVIAFVGHDYPKYNEIISEIHNRGAICIQGSTRIYDREFISGKITEEELLNGYQNILKSRIDIIEADLSLEAGRALRPFQQKGKSSKINYFHFMGE